MAKWIYLQLQQPIMVGLTGEDCLVAVIPPFDDVDVLSDHTYSVDNDDNRILPSFHRRPVRNDYVDNDVDTIIFGIESMNY